MNNDKIEATIQVSIGTCKKYVEDWEGFCKDIGVFGEDIHDLRDGINEDTQINLTLEQAKTHGII